MDKRVFWSTKSPEPEFHAVVFDHPAFDGVFRLVANQFEEVTLGGFVHTPAPMTIKPPEQSGTVQPRLTLSLPRQVVGREFKRQLKLVELSGSRAPIALTYSIYCGDTDAPQVTWTLYVSDQSGVQFNADTVQVTASDDNPMRRFAAPIYDPSIFTGLELI